MSIYNNILPRPVMSGPNILTGRTPCHFAPNPAQTTSKVWQHRDKGPLVCLPTPEVITCAWPFFRFSTNSIISDQCKIAGCNQASQQLGSGKHSHYCSVAHQK